MANVLQLFSPTLQLYLFVLAFRYFNQFADYLVKKVITKRAYL